MTQELQDRLRAAYAEDGFTMTTADIEARAGLSRRRRTRLVLGTAALSVVAVAIGAFGVAGQRPAPPPTVEPSPSAIDWDRFPTCLASWDTGKLGPQPPLLVQREQAGKGFRIYASAASIYVCQEPNGGSTLTNPDGKPRARQGQYNGHFSASGPTGEFDLAVGWAPPDSTEFEYLTENGQSYPGERSGPVFFLWEPAGMPLDGPGTVRVTYADRVELHYSPGGSELLPDGDPVAALRTWCDGVLARLPGRMDASTLRAIDTRGSVTDNLVDLRGDGEKLVACRATESSGWRPGAVVSLRRAGGALAPLHTLVSSAGQGNYLLGVAPPGAAGGQVVLRSGDTVPLSIKDGYFLAVWDSRDSDPATDVIRADLETPQGQISKVFS